MSDQSLAENIFDWLSKYADQLALAKNNTWRGRLRFAGSAAAALASATLSLILLINSQQRFGFDLLFASLLVPIIGIGAALLVATKFYQTVFGVKSFRPALGLVRLNLFGSFPVDPPYVRVMQGEIDPKAKTTPLVTTGGPGALIVFYDSAVVLENLQEHRGPAWRAVLPSAAFIERFERIESTIDLRPQERTVTARQLTTLDGIPIDIEVTVSFQIRMAGEPSSRIPYPADPDAILQAAKAEAHFKTKGGKIDKDFYWHNRINGAIDSTLKTIVSQYRLDELIALGPNRHPRQILFKQMFRKMSPVAERFGAVIQDVKFGEISVPEAVSQQRIDSWQSVWKSRAQVVQARGEAQYHREVEIARAQAQQEMIVSLMDALATAKAASGGTGRLIALRFIEWMNRVSTDTNINVYLPQEALNALKTLRDLVDTNSASSGDDSEQQTSTLSAETPLPSRPSAPTGDNPSRSFSGLRGSASEDSESA